MLRNPHITDRDAERTAMLHRRLGGSELFTNSVRVDQPLLPQCGDSTDPGHFHACTCAMRVLPLVSSLRHLRSLSMGVNLPCLVVVLLILC